MREFVTAVKEVVEEEGQVGDLEFKVDGREITAHRPKDGQIAMLMVSMGRHRSEMESTVGVIDFFVEVLDEESHAYIVDKLLDRTDEFGLEEVSEIMQWMIEEWTARPTKRPSVST